MRLAQTSTITLSGNTISYNTAEKGGGLFASRDSTAILSRNSVTANQAQEGGAGLLLEGGSTATMTNAVIADNTLSAPTGAGVGLLLEDSSAHLLHTTFARNRGGDGSGILSFNNPHNSQPTAR